MQNACTMFKCDRCPYTSNNKVYLRDHIDVVHEGVIIRCPIEGCPSTFTSRSNISQHVKQMHRKETFKCQECDYLAKTKRGLTVHFGAHHGVKYFACEFCDYTAGYQHKILKHTRRKHVNELTEEQQKRLNDISIKF